MLHTVCIPLWLWLDLDSWCFMMLHARSSHFISIRATNFALRCARAGTLRGLSTQFWLASCRSSSLIRSPACNSEVWQGRANAANIQFIGLIWFDMVWYGLILHSDSFIRLWFCPIVRWAAKTAGAVVMGALAHGAADHRKTWWKQSAHD